MLKVHYQTDQEELFKACGGHMSELIDTERGVKSAASELIGRDVIEQHRPDDDHFLIHCIAMGDTETYGCFPEGAMVRTARGQKPITEVDIGDEVLTHTGQVSEVTEVFTAEYDGQMTSLNIRGLPEPVVSTENHPFSVIDGALMKADNLRERVWRRKGFTSFEDCLNSINDTSEMVEAKTIKPGDYVRCPIPKGTRRSLVTPPYAMGLYLSEGCIEREYRKDLSTYKQPTGVVLVMNKTSDAPAIERLFKELKAADRNIPMLRPTQSSTKACRIEIGWEAMAKEVAELVGVHSTTKFIHPDIFEQDEEWIEQFLAGYLDGDGCPSNVADPHKNGVLTYSTASRSLAMDLQLLFAKLRVPASVSKNYNYHKDGCFGYQDNVIWCGSVGSSYSNRLLQHCARLQPHDKPLINRGQSSIKISDTHVMWKVTSVDSFEFHGRRYNLEVEGPHTYVVDIEGHNCNKNFDGWSKQALENRHNTFVTHGHLFREHRNRDPKQKIGDIKYAAFDGGPGGMHRVELLCWGNKEKAAEEWEIAKSGEELSFSMSARIPFDKCAACGHEATNPSLYCSCMKERPGQYIPEFKKYAFVDNPNPTFFDNSRVKRPADRIAHYLEYRFPDEELRKAASAQSQVILGTDWAEYEGLTLPDHLPELQLAKRELAEKLAGLEHQVQEVLTGRAEATDERQRFIKAAAGRVLGQDLTDDQLELARAARPGTLARELAKRAAIMPFRTFAAYSTDTPVDQVTDQPHFQKAGQMLPQIMQQLLGGAEPGMTDLMAADSPYVSECDPAKKDLVQGLMDVADREFGLDPERSKPRITITILQGGPAGCSKCASDLHTTKTDGLAHNLAEAYGCYQIQALQDMKKIAGLELDEQLLLQVVLENQKYREFSG